MLCRSRLNMQVFKTRYPFLSYLVQAKIQKSIIRYPFLSYLTQAKMQKFKIRYSLPSYLIQTKIQVFKVRYPILPILYRARYRYAKSDILSFPKKIFIKRYPLLPILYRESNRYSKLDTLPFLSYTGTHVFLFLQVLLYRYSYIYRYSKYDTISLSYLIQAKIQVFIKSYSLLSYLTGQDTGIQSQIPSPFLTKFCLFLI